ncbi:MAG: histidine ammonia-lyase [Alicyclobacillaceae bacterium]|jgi:histidine ammonia-lyase|uniref:histidine ammonia-lyase n=1 Tax=Alicyclobacillus sp. SP_1 TaxID=2942475 RepID=UPI00215834C5|nr:histidine ammonia-lyase [Alicyclobacillus sp. SP_1]MCY0887544.1 histidine ammonia-lyase [Alicyclobacillaceae bacterium]
MKSAIVLNGESLTLSDLEKIARQDIPVEITEDTWRRVEVSRERIEQRIAAGDVVYGVTTGFGKLADVPIPANQVASLQINLLRSHAMGVGAPLPRDAVRALLALRLNALVKGFSGIRKETLQLLQACLNRGVHPVIPSQGSLGASGDLAPLAHMALVLIGEGRAEFSGEIMPGGAALQKAGLTPVRLGAKEGLALINGTQAMTSVGALATLEAERVGRFADAALSLTMEALCSIGDAFLPNLHATRPHLHQGVVAERVLRYLDGSTRITRQGEVRVQDAYSIRCAPQVHGASWQAWDYVQKQVTIEMNAVTDNPIVLEDGRVLSGGHFHGQPMALSFDFLKLAVAEWASISERRTERLVNPQLSGLAPFLAKNAGLESGLMIVQYVAAALVSENKVLAHPASVDSIPSSANQEDHVSMGTIAARQVRQMVGNTARVVAIELAAASQAIALQGAESQMALATRQALEWVRSIVPPTVADVSLSDELETLAAEILQTTPEWML